MDDCANQSPATMVELGTNNNNNNNKKRGELNDDQSFLMYFIIGTYFGPDIKGENPTKSVLQRVSEGLPPYTCNQLTNSFTKLVELERVYRYVLRKADKSLTVKLPVLHRFFRGQPQDSAFNYPNLPDMFPRELHPLSQFRNRYKTIYNVVFIHNPDISRLREEDLERFKRLSGVEDLELDRESARLNACCDGESVVEKVEEQVYEVEKDVKDELMDDDDDNDRVGPAILFYPTGPTKREWAEIVAANKNGFGLTGSAAMGQVGPGIGLMDIGECEDAYLFRMSLPGVKRDEREFSCEVDIDGKVVIRGITTTGEKVVSRYSQVFEMQTNNLCPPGHFSITFLLPGPVDPHQFSGNFGTDGILEGIVIKDSRPSVHD